MWAITSYFNPNHYATKLRNFRVFREHLKVPLIAVEFSHTGSFELDDTLCDVHVKVQEGDVLWQKEALLNIGIKYVPEEEPCVTFVDADVLFSNPDWNEEAERALENTHLLQPFADVRDPSQEESQSSTNFNYPQSNKSREIEGSELNGFRYSFAKAFTEGHLRHGFFDSLKQRQQTAVAPGFALSGKKVFFQQFPLFDEAVIGGGDSLFWDAVAGQAVTMADQRGLTGNYKARYLSWAAAIHEAVGSSIGYVNGHLLHLWHGALENRGYYDREFQLSRMHFDPAEDLRRTSANTWKWSKNRNDLKTYLSNYFLNRKEDG